MNIPVVNAKGRFTLKSPFIAKNTVVYTVIAVRKISDLYLKGEDVYVDYYKSAGLENGVNLNGEVFDFNEEVKSKPVIVTLEGTDGTIIYVPSTYILSSPTSGDVTYSRLILSVDLGAVPDNVPVDNVMGDVEDIVEARFGVKSTARVNRSYSEIQPTNEEHEILEASRLGSITSSSNNYSAAVELKTKLAAANDKIEAMTQILIENNLI